MQCGAYKTVRELVSGSTATIFLAVDAAGDAGKPRFAVKLCTAGAGIDSEWQSEKDREAASHRVWDFLASTTRQKRAHAAGSRHVAAVHDGGTCEQGPWFATDYYPRTAQKLIEGHVTLTCEALHHIIHSVLRGALEYKAHTGESHGNIKPSNVLLGGQRRLEIASVALSDPFASKTEHVTNLEVADLRAIGELLYQLVRRRGDVSGAEHWPIETSSDWTTVYGDATPAWLKLGNQLLDPNLWQSGLTLESLGQQLDQLSPKEGLPWLKMAAVIVALGVVGGSAWWGWQHFDRSRELKRIHAFQLAVGSAENALQTKDYASSVAAVAKASALLAESPMVKERIAAEIQKLSIVKTGLETEFQVQLKAANDALTSKQFATAKAKANDLLALNPEDPSAKNILQLAQAGLDAMGDAERKLQILLQAAQTAFNQKQYAEADAKAKQALTLKPGDPTAQGIEAQARTQLAATAKLEADYKVAVTAAQDSLGRKQFTEAETKAKQALALKPGDQAAQGIADQARKQIESMVKLETDAAATLLAAQNAFNQNQYADAEAKAKRALALKPGDPQALKIIAQAQDQLASMAKLETDYKTAVTAAQDFLTKKQYADADTKAKQALRLKPGDPTAKGIEGQALKQLADMARLEADYKVAVTAAQSLLTKKQYAEAETKAKEALALKPGDRTAKGIEEQALRQLSSMARLEADYKAALAAAQASLTKKQYADADTKAKEALLLKPGDPTAKGIEEQALKQLADMAKLEADYKAAVTAAQSLFTKKQYADADTKAKEALLLKPGDPTAKGIEEKALKQLATVAQLEADYKAALAAAQASLTKKQYADADTKAKQALLLKPGDPTAKGIEEQALKQLADMAKLEADYKAAVTSATKASGEGKLALALFRSGEALQLRESSPEAKTIRESSSTGLERLMTANNWVGMQQAMRDLPEGAASKAPLLGYSQWLADKDPMKILLLDLERYDRVLVQMAITYDARSEISAIPNSAVLGAGVPTRKQESLPSAFITAEEKRLDNLKANYERLSQERPKYFDSIVTGRTKVIEKVRKYLRSYE